MAAARYSGGKFLQWADHFAQHLGGDMGIACGRFQLLVPEQDLDDPDIKLLFQQMGGKTVPQGMHRNPLVDLRLVGGGMDRPVKLAGGDRFNQAVTREQPAAVAHLALGAGDPPPYPKAAQQQRRQQGMAVFLAFPAFNAQEHALAVNVTDLKPNHLAGTQPGSVGNGQRRLVLQARRRQDQARHFGTTQHHRQGARHIHWLHLGHQFRPVQRHIKEELQPRNGRIEHVRRGALVNQVQLESPKVFNTGGVG